MKKIGTILTALMLTMTLFAGCQQNADTGAAPPPAQDTAEVDTAEPGDGDGEEADDTETESPAPSGDVIRIGVIQLVEHDALDSSYQGFIDGLKDLGYVEGENLEIDYQNAQGEQANCVTIADKFVNANVDMIFAIATPAAQAVANATSDIPILVTAVTDPADAKLVASNEAPGGNVTGTSDLTPCKEQMDLLVQLVPEAKKVGMLYCSNESNSIFQVGLAKEAAEALGLETAEYTVSSTNELQQVVDSMIGNVDVIYSPTDNMIAASMTTVSTIATENGIPTIVGESNMVVNGGFATYGISYYDLGLITARQAAEIFGGANPGDMPIQYAENLEFFFNEDTAEKLGIEIPDELK